LLNAKLPFAVLASINKTFQDKCTGAMAPSYPLGETEGYQDQSKDILNSVLNDNVLSDSDSEEPIEESWTNNKVV